MTTPLGHAIHGHGPDRVLVLHDWFGDHTSWHPTLPYLSLDRFTYAFADLRGYGASRDRAGAYTADEAASDALALADHLGWDRFAVVGHSMSSVVAQRIAQLAPARLTRLVALTPVAPAGMSLDDATRDLFRALALADDDARVASLLRFWGPRLSEAWVRYKARRWRETAEPSAVAAYVDLWGRTDLSARAREVTAPLLVVACEHDGPPFRAAALEASMRPFYPDMQLAALDGSGHYPMQEQPPLLATVLERFLAGS